MKLALFLTTIFSFVALGADDAPFTLKIYQGMAGFVASHYGDRVPTGKRCAEGISTQTLNNRVACADLNEDGLVDAQDLALVANFANRPEQNRIIEKITIAVRGRVGEERGKNYFAPFDVVRDRSGVDRIGVDDVSMFRLHMPYVASYLNLQKAASYMAHPNLTLARVLDLTGDGLNGNADAEYLLRIGTLPEADARTLVLRVRNAFQTHAQQPQLFPYHVDLDLNQDGQINIVDCVKFLQSVDRTRGTSTFASSVRTYCWFY